MHQPLLRLDRLTRVFVLGACLSAACVNSLHATDYFLTIGGGYNPSGNQASLEANVIFFDQVLVEQHQGTRVRDVYFADGDDPGADLQVLVTNDAPATPPATELLATLHRRRGEERLKYRNHHIPKVAGPLSPELIGDRLKAIAKTAKDGDRLFVYVTAHGSEGSQTDRHNTTIDCWNEKKITARQFTRWLNEVPASIPVVMVMAQCYCGGFSHAMFHELDEKKGLAPQLRAGFFAQQHDLPAAGCRPDIRNDEEFSSYFWGAIAGRSRTGVPVTGCDIDGNGKVSLAEAYAHAVIAGHTIDIPLRTSDVLLRTYSRMPATDREPPPGQSDDKSQPAREEDSDAPPNPGRDRPSRPVLTGTLQSYIDQGRPVSGRIVTGLSQGLGFSLQDDVSTVVTAYETHRKNARRPGSGGRRRGGSGRRDLLQEVTEKWPELGDPDEWEKSPLLKLENQEKLLAELHQLPSWKRYDERQKQILEMSEQAEQHELREVKFRRLISTLESIELAKHLEQVATPEVVEHYRQLIRLEESELGSTGR